MVEYIAHTPRKKMTRARAAAIFLREQGRCYLCSRKLRVGVDKYEIEHPTPLALGGSDDDADLRVVCIPCHKPKTKKDAADKAARDRAVTSTWEGRAKKSNWGNRGFAKAPKQHTATRPIQRKGELQS